MRYSALFVRLKTLPVRLRKWAPLKMLDTDVFLVSYPKSGNTWMRFMFANIISRQTDIEDAIDFQTANQYVPDIHINSVGPNSAFPPFPRIIKSHGEFNGAYPKVIYLVRDGRDVAISAYEALIKDGKLSRSYPISSFIREKGRWGVASWRDHVNGWLDKELGDRLLLLRYEDILDDPWSVLERCVRFCGVEPDLKIIEESVDASSFTSMRRIEETKGLWVGKSSPERRFTRRGQPGEWKDRYSAEDLEYFQDSVGLLLQRLGYENNLVH